MNIRTILFVAIVLTLFGGCASITHIIIDYQLPPQAADSSAVAAQNLLVEFEDQRADTTIFGPGAAKEFQHFSGLFSLYLEGDGHKKQFVGTYDLPVLFVTAFQKRLEYSGVGIAHSEDPETLRFRILLQQFQLDLMERSWTADVAYDVQLIAGAKTVVTKKVSGNAKRIKIVGKGDAEKVLAEIFSDTVNRLDVAELLKMAGL